MLLAPGSGQRQHPDLHRKPKDDLCGTSNAVGPWSEFPDRQALVYWRLTAKSLDR
jgi:hypothetical protein